MGGVREGKGDGVGPESREGQLDGRAAQGAKERTRLNKGRKGLAREATSWCFAGQADGVEEPSTTPQDRKRSAPPIISQTETRQRTARRSSILRRMGGQNVLLEGVSRAIAGERGSMMKKDHQLHLQKAIIIPAVDKTILGV